MGECLLKHNKRENNTERQREKGQLMGFDPVTLCSSCCGDYDPPRLKLNTVFCFSRFRGVPGRSPISHRDQVCAHTAWSLFLFGDKTHRELFKLSCLTLIYYIVTSDTLISHDKSGQRTHMYVNIHMPLMCPAGLWVGRGRSGLLPQRGWSLKG